MREVIYSAAMEFLGANDSHLRSQAMISYFTLAAFTTLYFIVLLPTSFRSPQAETTETGSKNWMSFFISGFRKSLNTFQEYVLNTPAVPKKKKKKKKSVHSMALTSC